MSRMVEVSGMEMMYSSVSFRRADRAQKEATLVDSKVLCHRYFGSELVF